MAAASVILTLQSQVGPQVAAAADGFKLLAMQQQLAEQRATRYAQAQLNLAKADQQVVTATQRAATATAQTEAAQARAEQASLRLAAAQQKAAQATSGMGQYVDTFRTGLIGIIGPMAVFNAAMSLASTTVQEFKAGFNLQAELTTTTRAIEIQLRGVRDSGQAFAEARAYADRYKLTQKEVNDAIISSIPVARQSTASMYEILGVFDRLTVKKPDKTFSDAARALAELQSGQVVSLEKMFDIPLRDANKMKDEIAGGADAVQVLGKYLDDNGIKMDALAVKTEGATGKLKELAQVEEKRRLAMAGGAGGLGEGLLDLNIRMQEGLTRLFGGDGGIGQGIKIRTAEMAALEAQTAAYARTLITTGSADQAAQAGQQAYNQMLQSGYQQLGLIEPATRNHSKAILDQTAALQKSATALSQDAKDKLDSQMATAALAAEQKQLTADSILAAQGLFGSGDQALLLAKKYGIAADAAQFLINQQQALGAAQAQADFRAGERNPDVRSAAEQRSLSTTGRMAADYARQVRQADDDLALKRAKTSAERIAILRREQAAATDVVEKKRIEGQIIDEQTSAARASLSTAKTHTTELGKQLDLEQKIQTSKEDQVKAALDAQALTIKDRQERRKEDQEIASAQRILSSGRASQAFRAAAADRLALIGVERQQRALAIGEQIQTAGGTIGAKGQIVRPALGGGLPSLPALPGGGGALARPSGTAGMPGIDVFVTLDGQAIASTVAVRLRNGLAQASAAGSGR